MLHALYIVYVCFSLHVLQCTRCSSGIELIMQYDQRVIDQIKVDDGYTPLHVAAQLDYIDHLCYLAAMVCLFAS